MVIGHRHYNGVVFYKNTFLAITREAGKEKSEILWTFSVFESKLLVFGTHLINS